LRGPATSRGHSPQKGEMTSKTGKQPTCKFSTNRVIPHYLKHITLVEKTLYYPENETGAFEFTKGVASFYFCLSGEEKSRLNGRSNSIHIKGGRCGLFMGTKGLAGQDSIPGEHPLQLLSLHIPAEKLGPATGPGYEMVPAPCRRLARKGSAGWFNRDLPMPPMVRAAVGQIRCCPMSGSAGRLFLEGKSLEIMAWVLDRIRRSPGTPPALSPGDIKRLEQARQRLVADLSHPPGLMELARFAGMHHTKLNRGFKQLYGKTVFACLTQARLETARHLLESGEMNCTEAAFFVGYSSPGHFTRAFKAQYQAGPNAFRRALMQVP